MMTMRMICSLLLTIVLLTFLSPTDGHFQNRRFNRSEHELPLRLHLVHQEGRRRHLATIQGEDHRCLPGLDASQEEDRRHHRRLLRHHRQDKL
jgi:hypothetical protein